MDVNPRCASETPGALTKVLVPGPGPRQQGHTPRMGPSPLLYLFVTSSPGDSHARPGSEITSNVFILQMRKRYRLWT